MNPPAALNKEQASEYLGLATGSRWLEDAPIPKCDMRKPGATKPVWRWRIIDLDAFLASRVIQPGHASPFGE